jgi:hypothetical protein
MSEETRLRYLEAFARRRQPARTDIYLSYVPEDRIWAAWIVAVLGKGGCASGTPVPVGSSARE